MSNDKIPEWLLERYLIGELPDNKLKEIENYLNKDPELKAKLEMLKKADKDILSKYPPKSITSKIISRYKKEIRVKKITIRAKPILFKHILYPASAFALVVVLFFFILPIRKGNINPLIINDSPDITRSKGIPDVNAGKPHLIVHRKTNNTIEQLKTGERAKEGDLLQLAYVAAEESYGVIISIDGSGTVTLHFPDNKSKSTALKQKKKILLPNAYELDNAPEFERFFFITSSSNINVKEILESAKALANDPLKAKTNNIEVDNTRLKQFSILIIKGE